jgi:ribonuclease HI
LTNNAAEYEAAALGLERATAMGASVVTLQTDSELMIKQLRGDYRVKNEGLKPLCQ